MRILLTLALLSEASLVELGEVTGYDSARVAAAIQNLSSLFLVEAPKLGGENRIRVSETTGRLVLSIKRELAADHAHIEKAIRDFRATVPEGKQRIANKLIGAAILQASALERQGRINEALETLNHVIRKTTKGKRGDLLAYVGYLHSKKITPEFDLSRRACREAFNETCFKPRLFETWFGAEWALGNYPGTEEVARAAIDKNINPIFEWRIRLAAALSSKAHAQSSGRISISVLPAYLEASRELSEAIRLAPLDEAHKWRSNFEDTNDSIYRASLENIVSPLDRLTVIRYLSTFIRQGDWRIRNYSRILGLIEDILKIASKGAHENSSQFSSARSSFEELQNLLKERIKRFPNDERHASLNYKCELLGVQLLNTTSSASTPFATPVSDRELHSRSAQIAERQEHSLDGILISSASIETQRPILPDHLSIDKSSPYYKADCFKFRIGIRLNQKERADVEEYCISEGWVMVPSGKTRDRRGKRLLIKIKGTVESFYKDS